MLNWKAPSTLDRTVVASVFVTLNLGGAVFVTVSRRTHYDLGKLVEAGESSSEVAFFDSPYDAFLTESVPNQFLTTCRLPEQTRVFYQRPESGMWQVGRVVEHIDGQVFVRFPNRVEEGIPEKDVHVRRRIPIADPTDYLAARLNETPLFANARSALVKSITKQRADSGGLTGLLSSSIELETHQVNVIRRVVQDPIQRYLLADEVGLGKTIEAGVLVRQYVLDDPLSARVLILVPEAILGQWRHELSTKLNLRDSLDSTIHVVSYSDPNAVRRLDERPGMIVVDEAHYLSSLYDSADGERRDLYEAVRSACQQAQRVLLLTATPIMRDEGGFLAVLHLLDPVLYDLNDRQGFRDRIIARKQIAELIGLFQPDNALFLADEIGNLRNMFPDDQALSTLLDELEAEFASMDFDDDEAVSAAISDVQFHLSETYRLHRRILRNRRSIIEDLSPGRGGLHVRTYEDSAIGQLYAKLENWRAWTASGERLSAHDEVASATLSLYRDVLECLAVNAPGVTAVLGQYHGAHPGLEEVISASHLIDSLELRIGALRALIQELVSRNRAVIVFCALAEVADTVYEMLGRTLGVGVVRHAPDADLLAMGTDAQPPWVLVCDHRAEEGLNLQGKNRAIVHFDLPFSPNRIEQRMGRVDRYGVGNPVESYALACSDNPVEALWVDCLDLGFGVFDRSIASLQYFCSEELEKLWSDLVVGGEDAFQQMQDRLTGPEGATEREFRNLRNFDALDAMHEDPSDTAEVFEEMDCDWRGIDKALRDWACTSLRFQTEWDTLSDVDAPGRPYRFEYDRRQTLIPFRHFLEHFLGAIDYEHRTSNARHPKTFPYTARRETAVHRGIPLLRIGDSFVDELAAMTAYDDRGRSFAMWRFDASLASHRVPKVYIKVEFVLESDIEPASRMTDDLMAPKGLPWAPLRRKADMMFPPFFLSILLDEDLDPVASGDLQSLLLRPYRPNGNTTTSRDFNLNPTRWRTLDALRLPILGNWDDHCRAARMRAEQILIKSSNLAQRTQRAVAVARRDLYRQQSQLEARSAFARGGEADYERKVMKFEHDVIEGLIVGMERPQIRIDSIGALFLSATNPFGADGGES